MTLNGNAPAPESRRINLNIGGRHFETTVSTLIGRGNNFFTSIIQHEPPSAGDEIFIDRDGDAFGPLLNYLRAKAIESRPQRLREGDHVTFTEVPSQDGGSRAMQVLNCGWTLEDTPRAGV